MEDTTTQPGDWLPYRARAAFNLFELAALLSRQDPERLAAACFAEFVAFNRAQDRDPDADTPHHFRGMVDTLPRRMLGDTLGELLQALKKATGATTYAVVPLGTARRAADALGVPWPPELPRAHGVAAEAVQRLPHQEDAILEEFRRLGLDPLALPAVQNGRASPEKAAVRAALPAWSEPVFSKAWKRLTAGGRIRYR